MANENSRVQRRGRVDFNVAADPEGVGDAGNRFLAGHPCLKPGHGGNGMSWSAFPGSVIGLCWASSD